MPGSWLYNRNNRTAAIRGRRHLHALTLAGLALLIGCTHIPLSSMIKLRNFNPLTTDARILRVAVRVPDSIEIPTDGVRFILGTQHQQRGAVNGEFVLEPIVDQQLLENSRNKHSTLYAFRIPQGDIDRFNQLREKLRIEKSHDATGELEVKADVCRTTDELPDRIPVSTYIKTENTDEFIPLLLNMNVLRGADRKEALKVAPLCQDTT